jgi:hypothetical protein
MVSCVRAAAACLLAMAVTGLQAQVMYRCGKTFQDRPCEAGVTEQRINNGGARADSAASPTTASRSSSRFAQFCARRGEHAQRITWQREGGATLERALNDARGDAAMATLVQDVYARRGSAPDVRASIESECIVEQEKAAAAADALRTLQQDAAKAAPAGNAPPPATSQPAGAGTAAQASGGSQQNPMCDSWRRDKDSIESRLRAGGTVARMESLQRERRDVEKKLSDARC